VAATLIQHGASPSFFDCVALGDRERVLELLNRDPELIHAFHEPRSLVSPSSPGEDEIEVPWGSIGGTALHDAVKAGAVSMVELLLERGADVNAATRPARWTPLHDATYYTIYSDLRHGVSIIRILARAGAVLDARTGGGYQALDIADYLSFCERSEQVHALLQTLKEERHT
jgi:hypothetical protein